MQYPMCQFNSQAPATELEGKGKGCFSSPTPEIHLPARRPLQKPQLWPFKEEEEMNL